MAAVFIFLIMITGLGKSQHSTLEGADYFLPLDKTPLATQKQEVFSVNLTDFDTQENAFWEFQARQAEVYGITHSASVIYQFEEVLLH